MMNTPISRRRLLQILATAAGGAGLLGLQRYFSSAIAQTPADVVTPQVSLPLVAKTEPTATPTRTPTATPTRTATPNPTVPPGSGPKVVHVHSPSATSWNFSSSWYGDYVNQSKVNDMVDRGLRELTSQSTIEEAWQALLPGYVPGKAIAIKVNFNNSGAGCGDSGDVIDGLAEPVKGLIRGMKLIGVREQDIWIYDAIRAIPARFRNRFTDSSYDPIYPNVHFVDRDCAETATFNSTAANASATFANSNLNPRHLADVLINATYLINLPIVKDHGITGVTLGFKNHYGSIQYVIGQGADNLHDFIALYSPAYQSTYSPTAEIFQNPHIHAKTVLTVGDGLYGCLNNTNLPPSRWQSFGDAALNSLFFAVDPVAIDCVMMDILYTEHGSQPGSDGADDYLKLAAAAGLGVFEHGQPLGIGYHTINFSRIEL